MILLGYNSELHLEFELEDNHECGLHVVMKPKYSHI